MSQWLVGFLKWYTPALLGLGVALFVWGCYA